MPESPTILVADDEEIVLNFVTLVLCKAGYRVLSAISGRQAVELVRESPEPVSMAVLDMVMPDLNGPELYAGLREIYPGMRALFMSGYNAPATGVPAGCDFLTKPFTAAELLRRVRDTVDRPVTHQA